ncbi:hypothetical protein [Methylophaga sp.]|uniref:hypothetical protein n=1 Tax=Methylophaga sp. TaxID=2024840 RepID=UPI003A8FA111
MFLRLESVLEKRALKKSRHYKDIQEGRFVPPIHRSRKMAFYPVMEVDAICSAELAGKTDDEIKHLVQELVALRTEQDPIAAYLASGKTNAEIQSIINQLNRYLSSESELDIYVD